MAAEEEEVAMGAEEGKAVVKGGAGGEGWRSAEGQVEVAVGVATVEVAAAEAEMAQVAMAVVMVREVVKEVVRRVADVEASRVAEGQVEGAMAVEPEAVYTAVKEETEVRAVQETAA
jgi:hypothetical protein